MKPPIELLNVACFIDPLVSLGRQFHSLGALTGKECSKRVIDLGYSLGKLDKSNFRFQACIT